MLWRGDECQVRIGSARGSPCPNGVTSACRPGPLTRSKNGGGVKSGQPRGWIRLVVCARTRGPVRPVFRCLSLPLSWVGSGKARFDFVFDPSSSVPSSTDQPTHSKFPCSSSNQPTSIHPPSRSFLLSPLHTPPPPSSHRAYIVLSPYRPSTCTLPARDTHCASERPAKLPLKYHISPKFKPPARRLLQATSSRPTQSTHPR